MRNDAAARRKQRRAKLGKRNPNYKTGKAPATNGYVTVPAPGKGPGGQREYEHRVKTHAKAGQAVHHKDHNRAHNADSNIVATTKHPGATTKHGKHKMPRPQ